MVVVLLPGKRMMHLNEFLGIMHDRAQNNEGEVGHRRGNEQQEWSREKGAGSTC